jgi:hypothetical protein
MTVTRFIVTINLNRRDDARLYVRYCLIMTAPPITKAAVAQTNIIPGLLKRKDVKARSPFMYVAIKMAAIEHSERKRETRSSGSLFRDIMSRVILTSYA